MSLTVREMTAAETDIIVEYFLSSTPEHLEMLGVDPTRFPPAASWRERMRQECALPVDQRGLVLVIWLSDDQPIGFSTSDKIVHGEQANMHLHVTWASDAWRVWRREESVTHARNVCQRFTSRVPFRLS